MSILEGNGFTNGYQHRSGVPTRTRWTIQTHGKFVGKYATGEMANGSVNINPITPTMEDYIQSGTS